MSANLPGSAAEVPLSSPYYGASLGTAVSRFFRKYATFSGRASRSEYWWWTLVAVIVALIEEILLLTVASPSIISDSGSIAFSPAYYAIEGIALLISLATLVPSLAITWRRLHDTDRSGGWYFIGLIPLVGGIILIVFLAGDSVPSGARYDDLNQIAPPLPTAPPTTPPLS